MSSNNLNYDYRDLGKSYSENEIG